jgi:Peptidase M50B-like
MYLFAMNAAMLVRDGRPPSHLSAALTGLAAALVVFGSRWTRHIDTAAHEGGHALVAFLAGRRVKGISFTGDGGATETAGRAAGPGMIMTAAAGYTATPAVGLFSAALLRSGKTTSVLILAMVALILLLLLASNLLGIVVAVVVGGSLVAVVRYFPGAVQLGYAEFLTWVLLLSGPKSVIVLQRVRRARDGGDDKDSDDDGDGKKDADGKKGGEEDGDDDITTDADLLAELTHIPAFLWVLGFGAFSVWCAVEGTRILLG